MGGDPLGVAEDLRREGVLLTWPVPGLFEQRKVDHRRRIAHRTRVTVPVPGTANVTASLDDANSCDPGLRKAGPRHESREAATDDRDRYFVRQRRTVKGLDVAVVQEVGEWTSRLKVLVIPIRAQPFLPLVSILCPQRAPIDRDRGGGW